jgi:hypothetical protein
MTGWLASVQINQESVRLNKILTGFNLGVSRRCYPHWLANLPALTAPDDLRASPPKSGAR